MIEPVGTVVLLIGGPGSPPSTAVIVRAGPAVRSATARLVDGKSVPIALGEEGWGIATGEGRIVGLTAVDAGGRRSPETFVG